jgi:phage shock protein E
VAKKSASRGQVGRSKAVAAPAPRPLDVKVIAVGVVGAIVVLAAVIAFAFGGGKGAVGWTEQGQGGSWTNIDAETLATWVTEKDFTLVNVKTPYIGEIAGTDLYIPYTDLADRRAELPQDTSAKIVVYCRAGNESRVAMQTLLDLGYTNLFNLDKGMESWTASGRQLIQVARG